MSTTNYLRVGIILTVTGVLALVHFAATSNGILPRGVDLATGIVLVVGGLPLLVVAFQRYRSGGGANRRSPRAR